MVNDNYFKTANSILEVCGRGLFLLNTLKKIMKIHKLTLDSVQKNPFFKEHISGSGWNGVPNQGTSSFDFGVIRGVTDRLGLRATTGNKTAIFMSEKSLKEKNIIKFSDKLHCEHTISIRQLRELILQSYFNDEIKTSFDLANLIILNQIVCTISKEERKIIKNECYDVCPFEKYPFNIYFNNKIVNNLDIYEIQEIYKENIFFGNILKNIDKLQKDIYYQKGKKFLLNDIKYYHRVPKNLEIFSLSEEELEKIYYVHKPVNIKYKRK